MEFLLKPHTEKILEGRGMRLYCCAPTCLHQPKDTDDPLWGREIKVLGYGVCPRCGHKTSITFFVFDEKKRKVIPKCEVCDKLISKMVYTQYVVSKHRRHHHYYYHKECYESMFVGDSGKPIKKRYRMKYAGTRGKGVIVYLLFNPQKGVCEACGKSVAKKEIKRTVLHHWIYAYKPSTVAKNPILILKNTSELCFACSICADGVRNFLKFIDINRIVKVGMLMPPDLKAKFISVCALFTERIKKCS